MKITEKDLSYLHGEINNTLQTDVKDLQESSRYYFDQQGKLFRPMTVSLIGKLCNQHQHKNGFSLSDEQKRILMISEMIHTSSLLHDDVIDGAMTRRNKPSINQMYSQKQAILAGNFVLSRAAMLLAEIGNTKAVDYFSRILDDLVRGELMQLVAKDTPSERFNQYLTKTYRKTAALVAYSCRIVALIGDCPDEVQERAYNYGKNIGIAFQLVDDALDFISTAEELGKPVGADISLGLATAPVLFAAEKYPDLHALIGRKFRDKGDINHALDLVNKSDGINETFILAHTYAREAVKNLDMFDDSIVKYALINLCDIVVRRTR